MFKGMKVEMLADVQEFCDTLNALEPSVNRVFDFLDLVVTRALQLRTKSNQLRHTEECEHLSLMVEALDGKSDAAILAVSQIMLKEMSLDHDRLKDLLSGGLSVATTALAQAGPLSYALGLRVPPPDDYCYPDDDQEPEEKEDDE